MIDASTLTLSPLLPPMVIAAVAGPALLLTGYSLLRRASGSASRLAVVAVLGAILLNPSLVTEQRQTLPDVALVVVDHSPSQQLGARPQQTEAALKALREKLSALPDLEVRQVDSPAGGDETRLFAEADRALADVPESRRAGVILLTDGQVHDVPQHSAHGPIHALITGHKNERDRRLEIISAPGYGLLGKDVTAKVRVSDLPDNARAPATLLLHGEDGSTERLKIETGRDVEISLPITHAGVNLMALEVEPVEGEITTANNSAALLVNGVRDRLRVLLISGMPHNGERVWRNVFKSDPSVDLVHFTILRRPDKQNFVPERELSLIPFPVDELFAAKLREFDLVVFDRYSERNLLMPMYLENIANYVRQGGALLDATGPDLAGRAGLANTPLGPVLPSTPTGDVSTDSFRPQISPQGRRHPVTASLPGEANWGPWLREATVDADSSAQVLMQGQNRNPLLLLSKVDEGRVAQITSDQIWLWARGYQGGGPQAELLRPLVHWLMKEPELEENRLVATSGDNRIELVRHSLEASDAPVTAILPDGSNQSITMKDDGSKASGVLETNMPGIYRFKDGDHSTLALLGRPNAPELRDQRASTEKLEALMKDSRGGAIWLEDYPQGPELRRVSANRNAAGSNWLGLVRNGDYSVTAFKTTRLLPLLLALLLSLTPLLAGWRREGK